MDIRVRNILSEIRAIKGAEHSVIAGGAVRDTYLGVEPKDFDIYIPQKAYSEVYVTVAKLANKTSKPSLLREKSYEGSNINDVQDIEYEGLKLQLMSSPYDNDETFGEKVISKFNFGINMIYYEGSVITRDTEAFQNDVRNRTITLLNIKSIEHLPRDCEKFTYLNKKLGDGWAFKFPKLAEIMTEEPKKESTTGKYKWHVHNRGPFDPANEFPFAPVVAQNPRAAEGRAEQVNPWDAIDNVPVVVPRVGERVMPAFGDVMRIAERQNAQNGPLEVIRANVAHEAAGRRADVDEFRLPEFDF